MPEDPAWWEAFEASTDQVHRVCAVLLELYSRPRAEVSVLVPPALARLLLQPILVSFLPPLTWCCCAASAYSCTCTLAVADSAAGAPLALQYVPLGRDVTSRAALPGQASPKTANVTPMRSPLPEASLAVSGAVTEGGGGGGAVSEVRKGGSEGAAGGSAANGVSYGAGPEPDCLAIGGPVSPPCMLFCTQALTCCASP